MTDKGNFLASRLIVAALVLLGAFLGMSSGGSVPDNPSLSTASIALAGLIVAAIVGSGRRSVVSAYLIVWGMGVVAFKAFGGSGHWIVGGVWAFELGATITLAMALARWARWARPATEKWFVGFSAVVALGAILAAAVFGTGEGYGFASLLPPLLAIGLAVYTRQVYLSLAAGIWIGFTIAVAWNPAAGLRDAIEGTIQVLADSGSAKVIVFTFLIGALIAVVEANGGMRGFVQWVEERRWVTDGKRAQILAWLIGLVIFIESNLTILVAGSVARPLFDRFKVSREKLAYIVDSTSAPVCILIPFNAWGAYVLGILGGLGVNEPLGTFLSALPLNFYAIVALTLAGLVAFRGWNWGPMRKAEERTAAGDLQWEHSVALADPGEIAPEPAPGTKLRPRNMIIPIVSMVVCMPIFMWVTGGGNIAEGSGSTSVLWAVMAGLAVAWVLALANRSLDLDGLSRVSLKGAGALTGMALVLWLAIGLGNVTDALGTGTYVAGVVGGRVPTFVLVPLVFVVTSGIAFATGSSWGTFAIMLGVAVPLSAALGLPPAPFVAAVLSGGIFGDHCSPISDTTIIASLASATDHIEHVRTQLPYAVAAGSVAIVGFGILGATL